MTCRGSPTAPKMVDVGKAAAVEGVGTTVTDYDPSSTCLVALVSNRQQMNATTPRATGLVGSTIGLRKLLAAACVTEGITPAFGQRLEAIVHSMEAIDDDTGALQGSVYDANIASAVKTTARQRFGGALRRNGRDRDDGGGGSLENFKTTYAPAKAPWSEHMRGSIETLYGTDYWGAKVLDLLTTSLTAITYSNYEGKIRLFAEFCIDGEGISLLDCTEVTCVRYLAWIADRGTIGTGSLQPYLSAINTFLRHTGREDARPPAQPSAT
eukprot:jgi/Tetstr1/433064/TSEL_022399.t1